jgi:hypothetical protein
MSWTPVDNGTIIGYAITLQPLPNGTPIRKSVYPSLSSFTVRGADPAVSYVATINVVNTKGWSDGKTIIVPNS